MTRFLPVLLLLFLPGCIVQEIHDSIKQTNDNLSIVQMQLNELRATNQKLDKLQSQLDGLDTRLQGVDTRLGELDTRLKGLDQRLATLDESIVTLEEGIQERLLLLDGIKNSLERLDVHLASLRVTIEKINSSIPFFDFGGGGDAATQPAGPEGNAPATRPSFRVRVREPATQPDAP